MGKKSKKKKNKNMNSDGQSIKASVPVSALSKGRGKMGGNTIIMGLVFVIILGAILYGLSYISHKDTVVIGVPNWESGNLTAVYLQEKISEEFDVPVQLKYEKDNSGLSNDDIYKKVASGDFDIHPETWIPLHNDMIGKYGDKIAQSRNSYQANEGICMIRSVAEKYGIDEVADLANKMENAVVWLGADGWGATEKSKQIAEDNGYADKFDLQIWEEEEALDKIREYEESEEPFVFYCYEPSKITDKNYDLVMLKNAQGDTADIESLHISYSKSLAEKYPEIVDYINNLELNIDMVNEWIVESQEEETEE